jgi:hypothetical protein
MRFPRFVLVCLFLFAHLRAEETQEISDSEPGFLSKVAWYLPNRIIDLVDIFRLRVGVGPGLEVGTRITDVGSLYAGRSRTVWVGLPGERQAGELPRLAGASQKQGLTLLGVDATDVQPNPPRYDFSEVGAQLHVGVVGVEAGIVPMEAVDFVWGLFGKDVSGDDLPHKPPREKPERGRVLGMDHYNRTYPLGPRPDVFSGTGERLDYLKENVPVRLRGYMHSTDRAFVPEEDWIHEQPPVTDLEIGLWYEYISSPTSTSDFDQKFRLDVELPNLEHNLSLFIDNDLNDRLPGTDLADQENTGVSVGLRRQLKKFKISSDVGIKTRFPPELFARIRWRPKWNWGETEFGFEQRLFWENEDGFGTLTQLNAYRWLGQNHHWLFRNLTAGRFTEITDGLEWQQTFILGHMTHLVEEERRLDNLSANDTLQCYTLNASVFGEDRMLDKYRLSVLKRRPVYKDFVLVEVEPGLEWRNEYDWDTQWRIDMGMVLLF